MEATDINGELVAYLAQSQVDISEDLWTKVFGLYQEKDKTISALEGQITKYKTEQAKNTKLISQLQEKIVQLSPNNNNTGSNFMMASQFKDYFDDFMKNCLPSCLTPLLPYPQAYVKYTSTIFSSNYEAINNKINQKLNKICNILDLEQNMANTTVLRSCLLKLLQQNSQKLIGKETLSIQKGFYSNQQVQEIESSQQYKQFTEKLDKICGYMILQEKKWNFIVPVQKKIDKFAKKDYVCIDGWIKEKEEAIIVLEGLGKEGEDGNIIRHPNLKNYVIPYDGSNEEQYELKPVNQSLQPKAKIKQESALQKRDTACQYSPRESTLIGSPKSLRVRKGKHDKQNEIPSNISSGQLKQTKSRSKISHKQVNESKIQTAIRKLSKAEQKSHEGIPEVQSLSVLIPFAELNARIQKQLHDHESSGNPSMVIKSAKLKHTFKTNHNLISDPSFEEIMSLPQRKKEIAEQLPLKRQASRTKKSNSRKTSAGKIVGQAIECKQNMNKNNKEHSIKEKECSKEAAYKQMIKQKLGSQHHKNEREKGRQSKNKHKEEDRPLRIMHFKKIREKYLNI